MTTKAVVIATRSHRKPVTYWDRNVGIDHGSDLPSFTQGAHGCIFYQVDGCRGGLLLVMDDRPHMHPLIKDKECEDRGRPFDPWDVGIRHVDERRFLDQAFQTLGFV